MFFHSFKITYLILHHLECSEDSYLLEVAKEEADQTLEAEQLAREKKAASKMQEKEKKRRNVTAHLMVEIEGKPGQYKTMLYRDLFGEEGSVYDGLPNHPFSVEVPVRNTRSFNYDDGYSCLYQTYFTPKDTPFMVNPDGTFSYQLIRGKSEYSLCGENPFPIFSRQ